MLQPRHKKIALIIAGTLIAVPAIGLIVLLNVDWNRAKPWLNERASLAIGRPFAVDGDLSLSWRQDAAAQPGWRGLVPWPHLVARNVRVGEPPGMDSPAAQMASASQFSFSLNPLALLKKTISIPLLSFETPVVTLRRSSDGKNNWNFEQPGPASEWKLDLQRVVFSKGSVHLIDAVEDANIALDIDTISGDPVYGVQWKLHGKLNGERVSGSGKAGAALSLQRQIAPYPIVAEVKVGATAIGIEGTLTKPTDLAALDMRLKIAGASMANLYRLTGMVLPETPPFSTEGHLLGRLDAKSSHWVYDQFKGKVGASDIEGKLTFESRQPRPRLSGAVTSRLLRLKDLGPVIGADSNASKNTRGIAQKQPAGKLLPVETFKTERWNSIDVDVTYSADKIIQNQALPINQLTTHLILEDGVLTLAPLNFAIAGGTLNSTIKLESGGEAGREAVRAEMSTSARNLKLKQLFPGMQPLQASIGEINGDAKLSARGNSMASLLGSSNGEIRTLINQGTISKLLLEEMGLNIGSVVLARVFGDEQVKLNCMAADFSVTDGLMRSRSFIVDTEEAVLNVSGTISLAQEQLDLTLKPDTRGLRVFSLRAPLYLRGSFDQPKVSVDKGVLALRAGGALALAAVAPIAALLPLVNMGPAQTSECDKLLAQARVKPQAPAPGQALRDQSTTKDGG
jgi:uncharacterized protein involved in outer membrane biogenesis